MKNIRTSIYIMLIAGLLGSSAPSVIARVYSDNECCERTSCEPEYDCGCPLNCGSLNIWLRGGVAPLSWRDRGDFSAVSCNALSIPKLGTVIVPLLSPLPQFKKIFHLPWIVGGQIGYAFTDCFEFYVEFNYRSASRRTFTGLGVQTTNDQPNITLTFNDNYRVFDAYVGGRLYWGRYWCDRIAFFLGAKFGLVHHKSICFNFNISSTACPTVTPLTSSSATPFFIRNTRPASGLNVGVDWCLGCGWSFMVMGEIVASCGPKTNGNIVIAANAGCPTALPTLGGPTNLIIGGTGTELYFPVTFGMKYSF